MIWSKVLWENIHFGKGGGGLVWCEPDDHPFLQIILVPKSKCGKYQRRPLLSLLYLSFLYDYDCDLLNNGLFISGSGGGLDRTAHQPNLCRQGITVHIRWWDKPHNAYMYTVQYCTFSQGPCYEKSMVRQLALHFCYPTSRSYNLLYLCSGEPRLALTHPQFWNAQMSINVKLDLLMPLKNLLFPLHNPSCLRHANASRHRSLMGLNLACVTSSAGKVAPCTWASHLASSFFIVIHLKEHAVYQEKNRFFVENVCCSSAFYI